MANEYYKFRHEDSEFCYDSENLRLMKGANEIALEKTPARSSGAPPEKPGEADPLRGLEINGLASTVHG